MTEFITWATILLNKVLLCCTVMYFITTYYSYTVIHYTVFALHNLYIVVNCTVLHHVVLCCIIMPYQSITSQMED